MKTKTKMMSAPRFIDDPTNSERIKAERCTCKHGRAAHAGALVHGRCFAAGCDCAKYTWAESVY